MRLTRHLANALALTFFAVTLSTLLWQFIAEPVKTFVINVGSLAVTAALIAVIVGVRRAVRWYRVRRDFPRAEVISK